MLLDNKEMKILEQFGGNYSKHNYGWAIAKKLKYNQKTVSNRLSKLEKENILKFKREGKNKLYYFNSLNPNIKEVIKIIELNKKVQFLNKHKDKLELFNELERRAERLLVIFGSYAKGIETKISDLDVFCFEKIGGIRSLEERYKIKINLIKAKKDFSMQDPLFKEIIESHIILKGVEDFIDKIWLQ